MGGKKADLSRLGHAEHPPPGIKGCHRHSPASTLCSQVGKGPDHLSGATLTPSPSRALSHCCSDSPCNHSFLFGAETRPGQWGEGSGRPSGQGLLWREGGGRKRGRPSLLESWEAGSQGKGRGCQSTKVYQDAVERYGDSKTSQVV